MLEVYILYRYYIDIIARDYYADPNTCYSDWDGMQHSLRIIATADEIENQFQITSGDFNIMNGNETSELTIVYHLKRYSEEEGDQGRGCVPWRNATHDRPRYVHHQWC